MVNPGKPVRRVQYPGPFDTGHAWAYLPDLGETCGRLIEREVQLADFDVYHFRGHYVERGVEIAEAVCDVIGIARSRAGKFPWWSVTLASPFVNVFRELREMRYLWQERAELDNRKLVAAIGTEPHTALHIALRRMLEGLGCLPAPATTVAPSAIA